MLTVAYLANLFPSGVEPYVGDEIQELRRRGVRVIASSVRKPAPNSALPDDSHAPEIVLEPFSPVVLLCAAFLCLRKWNRIAPLLGRVLFRGSEGPIERIKTLLHTWMGACYAVRLEGREAAHIHVHHGYFGSWVGMTAARLLDAGFSLTLHGSDLLVRAAYLDTKLANCNFCFTVSEYNRGYILERYPAVDPEKVMVSRLGVEVSERDDQHDSSAATRGSKFRLLAVGRLCTVKDHAFLVRACARLRENGVPFECSIAGDGPERPRLEELIRSCAVEQHVRLLGHVPHERINSLYDRADLVILTSRSEGIPLVLMEAMARGKIVLAPAITGIPELVIPGQTGFLYQPGSLDEFVDRLIYIHWLFDARRDRLLRPSLTVAARQLASIEDAARVQIRHNFNRKTNLQSFADAFVPRIAAQTESFPDENFVLQQI